MTHRPERLMRLLPIGWLRAGMLALIVAVACLEIGSGAVVAEAWRGRRATGTWDTVDGVRLDDLLGRLRALEFTIAAGAVVLIMLWSFVAVTNVRIAARSSRSALLAMAAWLIAPALVVGMSAAVGETGIIHLTVGLLIVQAVVLYLPFALLGGAADRAGGTRTPFRRWYMAAMLAFVAHQVFAGSTDLAAAVPTTDLGRTAVLYFANGLVIGVMMLTAADASRGLQMATADKVFRHNHIADDATLRFRLRVVPPPPVAPAPSRSGRAMRLSGRGAA